eukprot:CAMPEP_0178416538 /NCGR_PEP_ID=MMETSP0689_2-20121128/24115_1 /TAXON_ID=160604 /ORGANISM="Amphidinium massartii, Strain CS-259" /LENGTH=307 /DNA_ID=CAMNT_0020037885 /DNA_START=8 /DNA_END=932 /DNA_ORIENTATION=+
MAHPPVWESTDIAADDAWEVVPKQRHGSGKRRGPNRRAELKESHESGSKVTNIGFGLLADQDEDAEEEHDAQSETLSPQGKSSSESMPVDEEKPVERQGSSCSSRGGSNERRSSATGGSKAGKRKGQRKSTKEADMLTDKQFEKVLAEAVMESRASGNVNEATGEDSEDGLTNMFRSKSMPSRKAQPVVDEDSQATLGLMAIAASVFTNMMGDPTMDNLNGKGRSAARAALKASNKEQEQLKWNCRPGDVRGRQRTSQQQRCTVRQQPAEADWLLLGSRAPGTFLHSLPQETGARSPAQSDVQPLYR